MRDTSSDLAGYLTESISCRLVVDLFYSDERTWTSVPVTDWSLTWDIETATKSSGTFTIVHQDDAGKSLAPTDLAAAVSPFGQQAAMLLKIGFGDIFTETVLLGRFRITGVPQAVEDHFGFAGRAYVLDSHIQVDVGDLLTIPDGWSFRGPSVPKYVDSTWHELQSISSLPIDPSLPDRPTPGNLVYAPGLGGRMAAIQQLMSYLGGIAVTNEFGELTAVPYTAGPSVVTLQMGSRGTVLDVSGDLRSSDIVNEVTGEYQDDDGTPIYAWAVVDEGPLAVTGEFGTHSAAPDSDDTIKTLDDAKTRVRNLLRQYLRAHTVRYTLTCLIDPRVQIGDTVDVDGPAARASVERLSAPAFHIAAARVVSITMGSANPGLMTVVLDVGAALEASIRVGP